MTKRLFSAMVVASLASVVGMTEASAAGEGWYYKGWAQWHPQTGESTLAGVGTQCYFCPDAGPKDSDGDGVTDDKDQCPNTPKGEAVDSKGCPPAKTRAVTPPPAPTCPKAPAGAKSDKDGCLVLDSVHFRTGKHDLSPEARKILDMAAGYMKADPSIKLQLSGHTDSKGSAALNGPLSARRAEAVANYLATKGVDKGRVSAAHYSFDHPVADNTSETGRALNRRTDLKAAY